MFQLERELDAWKQALGQSDAMHSHDIAELEQHVRDSVAHLVTTGLSEEEAFLVAIHRVGESDHIAREFSQVNGAYIWGQRVFWMIAGFLFFQLSSLAIVSATWASQILVALAGGSGASMGMVASAITALCWFGLAIAMYRWALQQREATSIRELFNRRRVRMVALMSGAAIFVGAFLTFTGQLFVVRITPVNEFGTSALILGWTNLLLTLLTPMAFFLVMWKLQQKFVHVDS